MLNLSYEPNIIKSTENMTREEWLNDRRRGIGGSEASIVMGVSPWATKRDLYYDKIGKNPIKIDPEEDNWVAKQVGNRLEELVAMIFAKKTGLEVYEDKNMYSHPFYPFMIADLDFVIVFQMEQKGFWNVRPAIITVSSSGRTIRFRSTMSGSAGIIWR